jgi:hypothetical protein
MPLPTKATLGESDGPTDERIGEQRYTQMLWMGLRRKAAYLPGC